MCGIFGYLRLGNGVKFTCNDCGNTGDHIKSSLKGGFTCDECHPDNECADQSAVPAYDLNDGVIKQEVTPQMLYESFQKIKPRGPDRSTFQEISEYYQTIYFGFQRLAIMGTDTNGDQPFTLEVKKYVDENLIEHRSIYVICNGEIYNHLELMDKYGYTHLMRGTSDCEFLPNFYAEFGIEKFCEELRGEFACAVLDIDRITKTITIHLARDGLSVRPLFIGADDRGFGFASELKALTNIVDQTHIRQLNGGHRFEVKIATDTKNVTIKDITYFDLKKYEKEVTDLDESYTYEVTDMLKRIYPDLTDNERLEKLNEILTRIRETFEKVVVSVLQSHVPVGALLSGGLDSSLVVAIAAKHLRKFGKKLQTFSVGIPGATDRAFAEAVAAEVGTLHTHVEFRQEQFIDALPEVIRAIESYDITTVRASTGQYLISKWIHENTDIKVLLQGDYSDECWNGYMGIFYSPSPITTHNDSIFRLRDINYFDALRSDRGIASNSIEARTPFGHRDIIECAMKIDPRLKVPLSDTGLTDSKCQKRKEKWLLRKSFDITYTDFDGIIRSYLPDNILWRKKEGFSDAVSSKERSWYEIIQESVEHKYTQNDIDKWINIIADADTKFVPHTKEAVHYLELFTSYYGKSYQVIPYMWMHSFSNSNDPSARTLSVYNE